MVGSIERPLWVPVGGMVPAGSIGEEFVSGIPGLGEYKRPVTTFNQRFVRPPSFIRQHPDLVTYGDILTLPAEELDKFAPRFRLRERLTDYLKDQLILPHSRLLQAIHGGLLVSAPRDRELEIIDGVESALNQMQDTRRRKDIRKGTVLILRFGLYDGITRTLEEIAQGLEKPVLRERARQLEAAGFRILRRLTGANLKGCRVLPEKSFGREVFGAVLEKDLRELDGRASTEALHLSSDVVEALEVNKIPLIEYFNYPFRKIEDLVIKDLSVFEETPIFSWVKQEIALALQRRVVEVADRPRQEAEQKAQAAAERRAEIGEPRNNLLSGIIELSSQQLEGLDKVPLKELDLSVRAYNGLRRGDVRTVGELLRLTREELLAFRGIGIKMVAEVIEKATAFL